MQETRLLDVVQVHDWVAQLFMAAAVPEGDAKAVADVFTSSALRGVGHHELDMVPNRLDWLCNKGVNPRPNIHKLRGNAAFEQWTADSGLGELACLRGTTRALDLASKYGLGFVTLKQSNHFLAAAPYVDLISRRGMVGIVWSNTDATMRYPGGTQASIGNNPFGYGAPSESEPWIYDACMAYASLGSLRLMAEHSEAVPAYWGVDKAGNPCDKPAEILAGGSISPMGSHKGYALALLGEIMTGLLGDGTSGDEVISVGGINTHNQSILVIQPLDEPHKPGLSFAQRLTDLGRRLKIREPLFRHPGSRSAKAREAGLKNGIVISDSVWEKLSFWSQTLKVKEPKRIVT